MVVSAVSVPGVWPVELPELPSEKIYTERPADLVLRSTVEQGPKKQRLLVTANVRALSVSFPMTTAQVQIFDEFYNDNPASRWQWVNPRTLEVKQVRFAGIPIYTHFGADNYTVACKIEVMP